MLFGFKLNNMSRPLRHHGTVIPSSLEVMSFTVLMNFRCYF